MAETTGAFEPILLGTAARTMNPPKGLPLAGYPSGRPNTGVALDLCARAAAFGDAGDEAPAAALVVMDTIGVDRGLVARIRTRAAEATPGLDPGSLMVAATHTHSAVRLTGTPEPEDADAWRDYVDATVEAAAAAVGEAWQARRPVRARFGRADAWLGSNRRVVDAEGRATNEWLDPDGDHTGYFSPALRFLAFEDPAGGEPAAFLVSYGCHPVVLGPSSAVVCPDYPGYMVRALEAATGARTVLHITGAAANINPRECLFDDPERARAMGEALAGEVLAALPFARPIDIAPVRSATVELRFTLGPNAAERHHARAAEGPDGPWVESEVQAIRLGGAALVTAPGELFAEIGTTIENQSPFARTFVASCTNDALGYLSTETAQREGGYEVGRAVSASIERPLLAAARQALRNAFSAPAGARGVDYE